MSATDRIFDHGMGAIFLYLYSAVVLYLLQPELPIPSGRFIVFIGAAAPSAALILLAKVFNDELMELFAGEAIEEAFRVIDERTGDEEFYWDADSEIKEEIDGMDEKAHSHLVTILSGIFIAVSLPVVGFYFSGLDMAGFALVGSIVVVYVFCFRRYRDLQQVVKSPMKLYEQRDEN